MEEYQSPGYDFQIVELYSKCEKTTSEKKSLSLSVVTDLHTSIYVTILVICIIFSSLPVGVWAGKAPTKLALDDCKKLRISCVHGTCVNRTDTGPKCDCDRGWKGPACDSCGGRVLLNKPRGTIIDGYTNYTLDTKCTWLVEAPNPTSKITLRFKHFATECSWDHLYIYNGSSVWDPLVAVFSGLIMPDGTESRVIPEIVTHRAAYLHFYSDAAYNMSGFTIDYIVDACPNNCSDHGHCNTTKYFCECDLGWRGKDCSAQLCPPTCTSPNGMCTGYQYSEYCACMNGYRGYDCTLPPLLGEWTEMDRFKESNPNARTSHKAVVIDHYMVVLSGYSFGRKPFQDFVAYDFDNGVWMEFTIRGIKPSQRYGHSFVIYTNEKMILYGGVADGQITNEVWELTINDDYSLWTKLKYSYNSPDTPLAIVGHTAHMVGHRMYVIFGHSPTYGYVNIVQEFNRQTNRWIRRSPGQGALVKGGYGHSSVIDTSSKKIYIHAGYHSGSVSLYKLTDELYEYNYESNEFKILRASGQPRYLHSAVLLNNLMLVFGGNTHNDTSFSHGAKCYSNSFMAYDIECGTWHVLSPPKVGKDIARFGHSAVVYNGEMYIFGGFNGVILKDHYKYSPGNCHGRDRKACLHSREGIRCAWTNGVACEKETETSNRMGHKNIELVEQPICPEPPDDPARCNTFKTCQSCVGNLYNCKWCKGACHRKCEDPVSNDLESCRNSNSNLPCPLLHNCQSCSTHDNCSWSHDRKCVIHEPNHNNQLRIMDNECPAACHTHSMCENCTSAGCMWCSNEESCVESNSYVASFPYGQCREWTTMKKRCPATRCEELRTCEDCQSNPACGWCDDSSNTGLGTCLSGGQFGPKTNTTGKCDSDHWFFTTCPQCQCNGHSRCHQGTDQCVACGNNTAGDHCEICQDGFWGNPTNGGTCDLCACNGQADICKQETGKCFCNTKGVVGDACDKCEDKHYGDPGNGGTCFYELSTNYQFTFTLSSEEKHLTRINFLNTPRNPNRNVDFSINCSSQAIMTITSKAKGSDEPEQVIRENYTCLLFKDKFPHSNFEFGGDSNFTFFVYVYDFKTPFLVTVSFSQMEPIDLVHFFVTFFSCFLSLLLLAAVVWKVKQKYDLYRRRQRMHVEMEQMASRPFAMCAVDVSRSDETIKSPKTPQDYETQKRAKISMNFPSFVTYEPLACNKAAVLSLVVKLPTGDEEYTPAGQSGVTFGSTLVTCGNPRKPSLEQKEKMKYRKHVGNDLPTPDNCV